MSDPGCGVGSRLRSLAVLAALISHGAGSAVPRSCNMTIPIGALFHVTGSTAPSAPVRANVLERVTASMLALDDVHASSSVLPAGICLRVVVANTGANPERAVAEANRMVQDERVVGFVGPGTSDEAEAVSWLASAQRCVVVAVGLIRLIGSCTDLGTGKLQAARRVGLGDRRGDHHAQFLPDSSE